MKPIHLSNGKTYPRQDIKSWVCSCGKYPKVHVRFMLYSVDGFLVMCSCGKKIDSLPTESSAINSWNNKYGIKEDDYHRSVRNRVDQIGGE